MGTKTTADTRTVVILDRLAFCSRACLESALEYWPESEVRKVRVALVTARVLTCYGCGQHLDEAE